MKNKKRLFVITLSVLVLVVLMIFLFPKLKTGYMGKTVTVYIPKENIPVSSLITKDMIKKADFPLEFTDSEKVITNSEEIIGKYAKTEIFATDLITKEKLAKDNEQPLYEPSKLVGVTMSRLSSSVGGKLRSKDRVNVFAYKETFDENSRISSPDLMNLEVAYVLDNQGKEISTDKDGNSTGSPAVIVLKTDTEKQAEELMNMEYSAKVHIVRIKEAPKQEIKKETVDETTDETEENSEENNGETKETDNTTANSTDTQNTKENTTDGKTKSTDKTTKATDKAKTTEKDKNTKNTQKTQKQPLTETETTEEQQ